MASFSVDITDIVFAGGRTGYKTVTISNTPLGGITASLRGTNSSYFRTAVVESGVSYTISTKQANDTGSIRTAYVRFTNNNSSSDYVDVNLQQYSVSSNMVMYVQGATDAGSGNYSINVSSQMGSTEVILDAAAGNGASGSVTSGSDWLSSVQGVPAISDTGFLRFNAAYITNTGSGRTGVIRYVANAGWVNTLTIVQEGDAPMETLSVTPSSLSYDAAGGTSSIAVTYRGSTYNCDTTAVSSWVSVSLSQVMTGVLSGTVICDSNASTAQRSGSVWFSDTSGSIALPIVQNGRDVTLTVDKSELSYTSTGGSKTLAVGYSGTLITNATSMPSWLQNSYVTVDSSHRTYNITASENNTSSSRSFNFELQDDNMGLTVPITQEAGSEPAPALRIDPTAIFVSSNSGDDGFGFLDTIQTSDNPLNIRDVTYTISDPSWIRYDHISTGWTDWIYFAYDENTTGSDRIAYITFSAPGYTSTTVTVTQYASSESRIVVSPDFADVDYSSGRVRINITTIPYTSNVSYTISDNSWVSYNTTWNELSYNVNTTSSNRTTTITFTSPGYIPATFTLTQAASSGNLVTFSPSVMEFNYLGGSEDRSEIIYITRNGGYTGDIYGRISGDIPTIETQSFDAGSWTGRISSGTTMQTYCLPSGSRNDTYSDLTGKIEFYTAQTGGDKVGEIPIVFRGAPKYMTVLPDTLAFYDGSILKYRELNVFISTTDTVTVNFPSWTNVTLVSEGNTYKTYKVRCYGSSGDIDDGYIVFTAGGNSVPVYVKRSINSDGAVGPAPIYYPLSGGRKYVMIATDFTYHPSVDSRPEWITTHIYHYASESCYKPWFSYRWFEATSTSSDRTGRIKISGINPEPGQEAGYFRAIQEAGTLGTSPQRLEFESAGGSDTAYVTFTGNLIVNESSFPSWLSVTELSSEAGQKIYSVNVLRNTGDEREFNILFQDDNGMVMLPVIQDVGAPAIVVSPTSNVVGETSGTISISVYGPDGMSCNINGNWMSVAGHSGNTYTFSYDTNASGSSRTATATFTAPGYLPATYTLTQAAGTAMKSNPVKLKFHKNASTKKISFSNVPSGQVDYSITYIDGSGWLSVNGNGLLKSVSVDDNSGTRRMANIKFSDRNNSSNYVIVPVIQGGDGYDSIWMDTLYYPANRDTDGIYYYRIVDANTNEEYFRGISAKPQGWGGNVGGIDIPRLVEDHLYSDFVEGDTLASWDEMKGYCTVDVYNMTATGYPGVLDDTFKYWNDWSGYEEMYDYTVSLNDPINGNGCDNMIIPFCVYYDDAATFRVVETSLNGSIHTNTLPIPSYPFVMTYSTFNYLKRLDFKQDNDVVFSYDMTHCGDGAFIYRNRFGAWDSFLIEGNVIKTDNYTKQNYRKKGEYNSSYSINSLHHFDEKYTDNIDVNTTFEAHTGWLSDDEAERLVFHLLSSPLVYYQNFNGDVYDSDPFTLIPVRLTNSSAEYKKFRNGKRLVSYTITFEKSNIQKVRR